MFWQVDQGRFTHLRRTLVLDALDLLQGLVDGGFVGQQGIGDVELAFLFGGNGRHAVQRALITAVVGKAGARFPAREGHLRLKAVMGACLIL